ncbi:hypothetical protein MCOR25_006262 [Pyricularia grisea]|nr:hypothetical protein MCOR25_006262 [Pyricularia grisea]
MSSLWSSMESSPEPMSNNYSTTEYSFREDEADAIIKTVGFGSRWYDEMAVRFPPEDHANAVSSLSQPFNRISTERLGSLDCLPLELLQDVMLRLDLQSLFRFRQSNAKAREMVGTLKDLYTLRHVQHTAEISLHDLAQLVCTKDCAVCGDFASMIFLPPWIRYCYTCLFVSCEASVQTKAWVRKNLSLNKAQVKKLATLKTLAGSYDKSGRTVFKVRKDIISLYRACKVAGVARLCETFKRLSSAICLMACCCAPYYNTRAGKVTHGFRCAGCYKWYMDQLELDDDFWLGSPMEMLESRADSALHDRDSFLEHFKRCGEGQRLWESSDGGSLLPVVPILEKYRLTE